MSRLNIGSRAQVMHGKAKMTGGGLRKKDLKYNKRGKIVSRKASRTAKKANRLVKAGYVTKKGVFGVVRRGGTFRGKVMPFGEVKILETKKRAEAISIAIEKKRKANEKAKAKIEEAIRQAQINNEIRNEQMYKHRIEQYRKEKKEENIKARIAKKEANRIAKRIANQEKYRNEVEEKYRRDKSLKDVINSRKHRLNMVREYQQSSNNQPDISISILNNTKLNSFQKYIPKIQNKKSPIGHLNLRYNTISFKVEFIKKSEDEYYFFVRKKSEKNTNNKTSRNSEYQLLKERANNYVYSGKRAGFMSFITGNRERLQFQFSNFLRFLTTCKDKYYFKLNTDFSGKIRQFMQELV